MIPDILIFLVSLVARLFVLILKLIPFVVPDSWEVAIESAFSYLGYFQGWLPLYPDATKTGLWASVGIMTIVGWFITAIVAMYLMKGGIMIFHMFSMGKIHVKIPTFGKGRTLRD